MIEPDFLEELDRFEASLDRKVNSMFQGRQRSVELGEGQTFSDHRNYTPGDDIRLVDWQLLARTDELYVKQFEAERDLTVHVLVDASASMDFGEGNTHKFEYAAKLGLGFAYLAAEEHNDFRFSLFDETVERLDAGRSNRGEILALIDRLNERELTENADFQGALEAYAGTITSRSLVFVGSDLLGDPDAVEMGLEALAENDLTVAHVLSPDERDPPTSGDTIFEDLESPRSLRAYFGGRLERIYRERLESHVDDVSARCDHLGADCVAVDTGNDFFDSFADVWVG